MSIACRYISMEEASLMTEKLASLCRLLGVPDADLDNCINGALTSLLIQIKSFRASQADRKARIKLVSED